MRWVFFTLLLVNLAYFVWHLVAPAQTSDTPRPKPASDADTIYLLNEAKDLALPRDEQPVSALHVPRDEPIEVNESVESLQNIVCDALGPFFDRDQGIRLLDFLGSQDINGEIFTETLDSSTKYWVYVEPLAAIADAIELRVALSEAGIDSYLISEGVHKNGLSLGLYSNEANAQRMLERLIERDVGAKIEEKRSEINEYWVLLTEQEFAALDAEKSQQIREFTYQNQVTQKVCKPIASLR